MNSDMNFFEANQYLESFANLQRKEFLCEPKKCQYYLERMSSLLDLLDKPQNKIPQYIHITGTSGKGSVCSYLHAILTAAGKNTGSSYSPHPSIITQRWRFNDRYMTTTEFTKIAEKIIPALDSHAEKSKYDPPSFHEISDALGLIWFAEKKVEWAVMEVGCGGRYDSSNIIPRKAIAIITNIGLDHLGIIGNNKSEIAYEKSGIIKPGCAVFTAEKDKNILKIIQKECEIQKTPMFTLGSEKYEIKKMDEDGTEFEYEKRVYRLSTFGEHQIKNAILCIRVARYLGIGEKAIAAGLFKARQPLRTEVIKKNPLIILDGAHNHDKMKTTVESMRRVSGDKKIHLLVGFSADKEINDMMKQLSALSPVSIAATRNTINPFRKTADPKEIKNSFKRLSPKSECVAFYNPKNAMNLLLKKTSKQDIILVTGSIFLSGEIRGSFFKKIN